MVNDCSSPFKPDLKSKDFPKDFLIKLMKFWQYAWLEMAGQWYKAVEKSFGFEAASGSQYDAWVNVHTIGHTIG